MPRSSLLVRMAPATALWFALGACAASAASPSAPPADSLLPEAVVDATRAAVAAHWGIPAAQVSLSWGPFPRGASIEENAHVELLGTGASGWWVASITNPPDSSEAGTRPTTLRTRIRAGSIQPAAVATRSLTRGVTLREGDIRVTETVIWGEPRPAVLARPGWTVRSAVSEGTPLRPPVVDVPPVVRSGDPVEVHVARGRIALTIEGTALGTAGTGEEVRIRATTGRILTGTAIAPGRVAVSGGAGR